MKDVKGEIQYKDKRYPIVFNLNVMERIQEEYGSLSAWGEKSDGTSGEPDVKAVKFGLCEMINEGIDMENEENGANEPPVTLKQVGRIISGVGFDFALSVLNNTVIDSTASEEKNG